MFLYKVQFSSKLLSHLFFYITFGVLEMILSIMHSNIVDMKQNAVFVRTNT